MSGAVAAGAGMVAATGRHGAARFGGSDLPKPAVVIMAYTGHSEYTASEPPTFLVAGENDAIAPAAVMERRVEALRRALEMARKWRGAVNRYGGDVQAAQLPETGIRGNTHFAFSGLNNVQAADLKSNFLAEKKLD